MVMLTEDSFVMPCSTEPSGSVELHTRPEGLALHAARLPYHYHLRKHLAPSRTQAAGVEAGRQILRIEGSFVLAGALHLTSRRPCHNAPKRIVNCDADRGLLRQVYSERR